MLSTRQVYLYLKSLDLAWYKIEKLVQELAWRDYWQQVWRAKKDDIKTDLKNIQSPVKNHQIPKAVLDANTGITAVDEAIQELYKTGYMHNHMRMYVAAICCNIAQCHWLEPAQWMYSHLKDGDLASNYLSWQWVAGAFANKKYYANQENINNFFKSTQRNTFLDVDYSEFETLDIPKELEETCAFEMETLLPKTKPLNLDKHQKTLIYNYYNIDPEWYKGENLQRIFLMEPSFFKENPVDKKCLDFALALCENIKGIQFFVGEFSQLSQHIDSEHIIFKEHPTNAHYNGTEEAREWLSSIEGYFPSFFSFWKKCKKEL